MVRAFKVIFFLLAVLIGIVCVVDFFVAWQQVGHPPGYQSFLDLIKEPAYYSHKVFILSLSYFLTQIAILWLIDFISIRMAKRELGAENTLDEWSRGASYMVFGLIAFIEASIVLLILLLSLLIGYWVDLSAWYFLTYGILAGGVGFGIRFIVSLFPSEGFWDDYIIYVICPVYAVVAALFFHIIDFYL